MSTFVTCLQGFRSHLVEARECLETFHLDDKLQHVAEAAEKEEFRVSVFGRFKTGKSTVINALLGDAISPSNVLPCTSTLIEFRPSERTSFFEVKDGIEREKPKADFERYAASAAKSEASTGSFWRVKTRIPWSPPGFVLVDTPGTDEDTERLAVSNQELERTDAAIVVLNATQMGALSEMDQAGELKRRVGIVVLVVNKIDMVRPDQQQRLLDHARNLAESIGIPAGRVLPGSAHLALQGDRAAVVQMDRVRDELSEVLLRDIGGARLQALMNRTEHVLRGIMPELDKAVAKAVKSEGKASHASKEALARLRKAESDLGLVEKAFADAASGARSAASAEMKSEWPGIVSRLEGTKERWRARSSPLFSPKQCATELGDDAQRQMQRLVKDAVAGHVQPKINAGVEDAERAIHTQVAQVVELAASAGIGRPSEIEHGLHTDALQAAFGKTIDDVADDSAAGSAVTVVVSAMVGYVIADIILFYVLGLVAGFFNPVILAGAVVVGIGAYLFVGEDALKDWMRSKIATKLTEELGKPAVRKKVSAAVADATQESFDKLSHAYVAQLKSLIDKATTEWKRREAEHRNAASLAARSADDAERTRKAFASMLNALASDKQRLESRRVQ